MEVKAKLSRVAAEHGGGWGILLVLIFNLGIFGCAGGAELQHHRVLVHGVVFDSCGSPLSGVAIDLYGPYDSTLPDEPPEASQEPPVTGISDIDGRLSLGAIDPGMYWVMARGEGIAAQWNSFLVQRDSNLLYLSIPTLDNQISRAAAALQNRDPIAAQKIVSQLPESFARDPRVLFIQVLIHLARGSEGEAQEGEVDHLLFALVEAGLGDELYEQLIQMMAQVQ